MLVAEPDEVVVGELVGELLRLVEVLLAVLADRWRYSVKSGPTGGRCDCAGAETSTPAEPCRTKMPEPGAHSKSPRPE